MHRRVSILAPIVVSAAMGLASSPTSAQIQHALSPTEEAQARAVEQKLAQERLALPASESGIAKLAQTPAGREGKSVVVSVMPVGSAATVATRDAAAPAGSPSVRRAVVTRYNYATGFTTRTWIDVAAGTTLAIRNDLNYPTPLAQDEFEEAKSLLRSKVPEVDRMMRDGGAATELLHLVPVSTEASSPRYGHRVVWLWLVKPVHSDTYLVDLSTKEVERVP